jgi:hypothetical protein
MSQHGGDKRMASGIKVAVADLERGERALKISLAKTPGVDRPAVSLGKDLIPRLRP